jgi:hypothetical protein
MLLYVQEGVFVDTWLVSALVMLVAASGFGENIVSELVTQLFVRHPSEDGDPTLDTDVGAYCVRIYRNGDYFPVCPLYSFNKYWSLPFRLNDAM